MRRALLAMLVLSCFQIFCGDVYNAPDREPSPEETLMLEYMNRFRAEPAFEADRLAPGGVKITGYMGKDVDWALFKSEVKALKPAPPLVFNLNLLDAARKHSHYMILNEQSHDEAPAKSGFTGGSSAERVKAAGYSDGRAWAENIFRDAQNVLHSHAAYIVDFGPGPGNMQPGRGHRANMIHPGLREVGCSYLPHSSGKFSVTHNFSARGIRMAGGVVYVDRNGNNFYDIGEGLGGVKISVDGGPAITTWKSGAYAIELGGDGEHKITAEQGGQSCTLFVKAGSENVKFDWVPPARAILDRIDSLTVSAERIKDPKAPGAFAAQIALYMATRNVGLDEKRQLKITPLLGTVGDDFEARQKTVLEQLKSVEAQTWQKFLSEQRKPYNGTAADVWFREADLVAGATLMVANLERQGGAPEKKQYAAQLEQLEKQLTTAYFKGEITNLAGRIRPAAATPASTRR